MINKNAMLKLINALPLTNTEYRKLRDEVEQTNGGDRKLQEKFAYLQRWQELTEIDNKILELLENWGELVEKDRKKIVQIVEEDRRTIDEQKIAQLREKLLSSEETGTANGI